MLLIVHLSNAVKNKEKNKRKSTTFRWFSNVPTSTRAAGNFHYIKINILKKKERRKKNKEFTTYITSPVKTLIW